MVEMVEDIRLRGLLEKWGFADLVEKFTAADVDFEAFALLDDDNLRRVLSLGQYVKFKKAFHEIITSIQSGAETTDAPSDPPTKRQRLDNSGAGSLTRVGPVPVVCSDDIDEGIDEIGNDTPATLSSLAQVVRDVLNQTLPGKILLSKQFLEEPDRNRLSEVIVNHYLLLSRGELSSSFLTKLSKTFIELFPEESPITYYSPYTKVLDKVFYAKGKLVNQYYAWREDGIKAGILPSKPASCAATNSRGVTPTANEKASLEVLSSEVGPEANIRQHWLNTYEHRIGLLHQDQKYKQIHFYFALFPCLRQPWAASSLLDDYAQLQPESGSLVDQWPTFANKIVSMMSKKKILCKDFCAHLKESITETGEGCQELLLQFSKLFRQQLVVKGNKKHKQWTANKTEIQEGFFHHVGTDAQLNDFITNRQKKLSNFAKVIPFQPLCVVVGLTLDNITSSYCVIATERFKAATPLTALDMTFKAVHALDLSYSPDAKALWYFLQHAVYKIQTPKDEVITYLPALLSTYERS